MGTPLIPLDYIRSASGLIRLAFGMRVNLGRPFNTKGSINTFVQLIRLACFGLIESRNLKYLLRKTGLYER